MKLQTIKYMFKEGFLNAYRNKLMSIVSISMVIITLIIFGIYMLFMLNVNYNARVLQKDYQIQIYCNELLDYNDPLIKDVENSIKQNSNVQDCVIVSKAEGFDRLKGYLSDDPTILDGMTNEFIPVSFTVKIKDSKLSQQTGKELEAIPNVRSVKFSQKDMDLINKFIDWLFVFSILTALILLLTSIFIISNTIRLTVFSRRKDINIMKYVGATDAFIRGPFLLEGAIIGFLGSIVAFLLVSYGYSTGTVPIKELLDGWGMNTFKVLQLSELGGYLFLLLLIIGVVVGMAGSIVAIRKHLKV